MKEDIKALVEQARSGSDDAFYALIDTAKAQSYKIAYTYVKNEQDALDVLQESVCKAYKSIKKLKQAEFFTTWFIRIIINESISMFNKNKNTLYLEDNLNNSGLSVDDESEHSVQNMDLRSAIDSLDVVYKTIIILRFYKDMRLEEIAIHMKIPLSTVKTRLYKALKILKLDIKEMDSSGI